MTRRIVGAGERRSAAARRVRTPSVARNVCQLIPPATAVRPDLQRQPGAFREHYNEHRPSRAVQRSVPGQAYRARPKAGPAAAPSAHYRLRYDHVDAGGKASIRRAGRMHHLGVGIAHRGKEILAVTDTSSCATEVDRLRLGPVGGDGFLEQALVGGLAAEAAVRPIVVVEVLPFLEFVVEQLGVVDEDAFELTVELLGVDPVAALDLAVEPGGGGLDVDVPDPAVGQVPVESRLEL
jgi:hypothetical protein